MTERPPDDGTRWRTIGMVAAAGTAGAAFLPWVSARTLFGSSSAAGTEGDGTFTLVLGGVALLGFAVRQAWIAGLASITAVLVAVNTWRNISTALGGPNNEHAAASAGVGLYVTVVAGTVATIAAVRSRRRPA